MYVLTRVRKSFYKLKKKVVIIYFKEILSLLNKTVNAVKTVDHNELNFS